VERPTQTDHLAQAGKPRQKAIRYPHHPPGARPLLLGPISAAGVGAFGVPDALAGAKARLVASDGAA